MPRSGELWSVGALARIAGLTVRALHHYDETGLLRPGERTAAGHRRYSEADLQRLYRIRLLRRLGLPLEDIQRVLDEPEALRDVLDRRAAELDDEIWRLGVLRKQAGDLAARLGSPQRMDLVTLAGSTGIFTERLTREQKDELDERYAALSATARDSLEAEWPEVLSRLAGHFRAQDPATDPEVQESVRRLRALAETYAGGDRAVMAEAARFIEVNGHGLLGEVLGEQAHGLEGLWEYVTRMCLAQPG
ncbi:MerR family transcriptional regulator [Longispora albida]|uniref:MerR family transcriptional regulator n=1 Tax=Longispora albida TaxID=203523 RepID=UPI000369D508|nr:MerR family transcriptional regulator [Longispora albida]